MAIATTGTEKSIVNPTTAAAAAPEDVLKLVDSSPQGLTGQEAHARLERVGRNEVGVESRSFGKIVLEQAKSPINILLAGAGVVTVVTNDYIDGAIILALVFLNVTLSIVQEFRAEKALEALRAMLPVQAHVVRDGQEVSVPASELVPGDLVNLNSGDLVPADIRVLDADGLQINQASLTGESVPQTKSPAAVTGKSPVDWKDIAFAGTVVVGGEGEGVVITTGASTQFGETASLVKNARASSDFQVNLAHFGRFLLVFGLLLATSVFLTNTFMKHNDMLVSLTLALAIALGIVPEALPAITATTLALGAKALAKKKVLVRRLASVEDLSAIDVLCIDKTGTITENRTQVVDKWTLGSPEELINAAALCTSYPKKGVDVIDDAVIEACPASELAGLAQLPRRTVMHFSADTKRMSVSVDRQAGSELITKGAATVVLARCTRVRTQAGDQPLGGDQRKVIDDEVESLEAAGGRVLAVASRALAAGGSGSDGIDVDTEMTLIGLLSLSDPPRAGAADALAQAARLGIEVKIVTGDALPRAAALARQVGLDVPDTAIIAASELSGPGVEDIASRGRIFAEAVPADKFHLVKTLQHLGHHVAATGDGVNDAPALEQSDVGIALATGTDATKGAADLVLLDDNLQVIVDGIRQGRSIFTNMNRYLTFTMVSNLANAIIVAIASFFLNFLPLQPEQVLLMGFLTDLPMLAMVTDKVADDDLATPRRWHIGRSMELALCLGIVNALFAFGILTFLGNRPPAEIQTAWFLFLNTSGLIVLFALRTHSWFWSRPYMSGPLLGALAAAVVITFLLPNLPPTQSLLKFGALGYVQQAEMLGFAAVYLVVASGLSVAFSRLVPPAPARTVRWKEQMRLTNAAARLAAATSREMARLHI